MHIIQIVFQSRAKLDSQFKFSLEAILNKSHEISKLLLFHIYSAENSEFTGIGMKKENKLMYISRYVQTSFYEHKLSS